MFLSGVLCRDMRKGYQFNALLSVRLKQWPVTIPVANNTAGGVLQPDWTILNGKRPRKISHG